MNASETGKKLNKNLSCSIFSQILLLSFSKNCAIYKLDNLHNLLNNALNVEISQVFRMDSIFCEINSELAEQRIITKLF